jgi:hypothetical protein
MFGYVIKNNLENNLLFFLNLLKELRSNLKDKKIERG